VATRNALKAIDAKKAEIAISGATLTTRLMNIAWIEKEQQRLRENMRALKGSAEEKQLLVRYTRQLNAQEDQLEAFTREKTALEQRMSVMQAELRVLLDALSLDVVVAGLQ
jgi:predicted RNase H-like nuclease (RuvC/YqgF family)